MRRIHKHSYRPDETVTNGAVSCSGNALDNICEGDRFDFHRHASC
jgi:hypothetical protein